MLNAKNSPEEISLTETHTVGPIGTLLADRFRVERLIGNGGMAAVYEASDVVLGRTVALKLFRTDAAEPERQSGEVTVLASLNHFALVTLFDAGTATIDGVPVAYIVMEYVDGHDLRSRIAAGPMPPVEVAQMGADLAEALHYVHTRGIIHRDIKPANVLLGPAPFPGRAPQAKLADFGIARLLDGTRLTATGNLLGTASYLSPEQALGTALGPPTDIYSLGLVLLECLTGVRVYPGSAVESAMARLQRQPEIPAELGPAWAEVLRLMTSRDPADRPDAGTTAMRLRLLAGDPHLGTPAAFLATERPEVTAVTAVLPPAAPTTSTQVAPVAQALPTAATPAVPAAATARTASSDLASEAAPRNSRRWAVVALAVVAAALAAVLALVFFISQPAAPGDPAPSYPAVDGSLGEHLKQLQESVAP